jgi:ABC-type multidrug transport system permease subunit
MYHLDPFTYLIEGLVSDVLQDVPVRCRENEFYSFDPPPGQTCIEYAGRFASAVGGYFADPDASTDCRYCQYSWGQNFFAGLNIKFIHRWRNFAIFIGYTCFNVGVLLVAARLFKWRKR